MLSKMIKTVVVLLCLFSLVAPTSAQSAPSNAGIPPFPGAPMCADTNGDGHPDVTDNKDYGKYPDNELWHDLWNEVNGCHYNHEHGDSPDLGNKYFGAPGALWGGQTIAYPFKSSPTENTMKHSGYMWYIRTPEYHALPACGKSERNDILINRSDFCVVAVRAQIHIVPGLMDVATRLHSGYVEVYACRPPYRDPQDCGTFKMGSSLIDWGQPRSPFYKTFRPRPFPGYNQPTFTIDFGNGMMMEFKTDTNDLPSKSGEPYINVREFSQSELSFFRSIIPSGDDLHVVEQWSSNDYDCEPRPPGDPCHNSYFHFFVSMDDSPTLLDVNDMRIPRNICQDGLPCHYNGSLRGLNEIGIRVLPSWDSLDGVIDGFVTWSGYTDRFGNPRTDNICTTASPDCVPFEMNRAPVGVGQKNAGMDCLCAAWEYDIYFNDKPSGWIQFASMGNPMPTNTPNPQGTSMPTNTPDHMGTPAPSSTHDPSTSMVTIDVNPTSLNIGGAALVSVKLNNVPAEGYQSAEFACAYNPRLVEKNNIVPANLFGADTAVAIHDPQDGTFIVAMAGTNGNKATVGGLAFTFEVKALQPGQSSIHCTTRVSKGDHMAMDIPSTGGSVTVMDMNVSPTPMSSPTLPQPTSTNIPPASPTAMPTDGSITGQIIASKPATVSLYDANNVVVQSVVVNPDGTFTLTTLAGNYTVVASAKGFLGHQGLVSITAGNTTVKPAITLLAGDIDGNNVIDQFDALTVGMSYASSTPVEADLNNDGVIDFLDLELLAENYHKTGPSVWQ